MCESVILENTGTFLPDCYKNQKLCNKTIDSLSLIDIKLKKYVIKLSLIILLQQNFSMYDKANNTCVFVFNSVPDQYAINEICGRVS